MTEISCQDAWRALSDDVDGEVNGELCGCVDAHLKQCPRCKSIYEETKKITKLIAEGLEYEMPKGFSKPLYDKDKQSAASIALPDFVSKTSWLPLNPETFHC